VFESAHVPVQYNIVDCDAYMQYGIHNVESSSVQHQTKTRPPTNQIPSAQLGSLSRGQCVTCYAALCGSALLVTSRAQLRNVVE
jgi:hypothetical protein